MTEEERLAAQRLAKLVGWSDLRAALAEIGSNRKWVVDGLIEGRPTILWAGAEKSQKTWVAIALCLSIANGVDFADRFAIPEQGPVVYLDFENGAREFARRAARLSRGLGIDTSKAFENVHHFEARGIELVRARPDDQDRRFLDLVRSIKDLQPKLVVIDPMRNALAGDENSAVDVLEFFETVAGIGQVANSPNLVLHHLNKSGGFSGSRAMKGRADLIIEGSDERQPWYSAVGRTIRHGDVLANRFAIDVRHQNDGDDLKATTTVAFKIAGEAKGKSGLSPIATNIIKLLARESSGMTANQLRLGLNRNSQSIKQGLEELLDSCRVTELYPI